MNILIISRVIQPRLTPRAFRTVELAKELARQGHNVTLYAVLGNYDYSVFRDETGISVKNIGNMFFATSNSDGKSRYTFIDKILYHLLNRLIEFPDIELMFRVFGVINIESSVDLLITIAYPHTIHWGATLAKSIMPNNKFPKVWVSDCGDPYMGDAVNKKKMFYFEYIERWWSKKTDYITVPIKGAINAYYSDYKRKVKVIPQGYNLDNILTSQHFAGNKVVTFAYSGSVYPGYRDLTRFMEYLLSVSFAFKFVIFTADGQYYMPYKAKLKDKLVLKSYVERDHLIYELSEMDFLVNIKNPNETQLPSKIIDYMLTNRPILEISTEFTEKKLFNEFMCGNYDGRFTGLDVTQYDIKNVAKKFLNLYYENTGKEIQP